MQVFGGIGALQVPCPFATGEVRDTMTLISMRREVQGQGHSQTTLPLSMQTWRGAAHAISLGVDVCAREVAV
jgi:hypothetical protein